MAKRNPELRHRRTTWPPVRGHNRGALKVVLFSSFFMSDIACPGAVHERLLTLSEDLPS